MAGLQTDDAILAGYAEADRDQYIMEKKFGSGSHDHIISETTQELDGIHDGLEFPTDEERDTLRRVSDSLPWSAYCECSSCSLSSVLPPRARSSRPRIPFPARANRCLLFPAVIATCELAERFSYYGCAVVFVSGIFG